MNAYIIEAHLECHRQIMELITTKLPKKKTLQGREHTLQDVTYTDGALKAEYSYYEGCGSYSTEHEWLDLTALFKETT